MKKIVNNPYFDKALSTLIAIGVAAAVYFIIDVRDFIRFRQPIRDELQDKKIEQIYNDLVTRINYLDSAHANKTKYIHYRLDRIIDMINYLKNQHN